MLVYWNQQRMKIIPLRAEKKGDAAKFKGQRNIILYPGWNDVDDELWPFAEKNRSVQQRLEEGELRLKAEKKKDNSGKEKSQSIPFEQMDANEAVALVAETNDPKTLNKWLKKETRDEVRASIKDKLDEIESRSGQSKSS